jgi:release factor glutamine methyltransferase
VDHCIQWFCGNWDAALAPDGPGFDLIVSNPPYIRSGDMASLQPEIRLHEPLAALDGSEDGLLCLQQIIASAHGYLQPGGLLALEMGCDQADAVRSLAKAAGCYASVRVMKDYGGLDRVVVMEKLAER